MNTLGANLSTARFMAYIESGCDEMIVSDKGKIDLQLSVGVETTPLTGRQLVDGTVT